LLTISKKRVLDRSVLHSCSTSLFKDHDELRSKISAGDCTKAADHLVLVRDLFYSDPENLIRAASLCYASGQLQPSQAARQLVQRALEIAPANETAIALLKLLEKRIAEASGT
jgi:hypothetical protein